MTRENHGDAHHVFTLDDNLIPLRPGPRARKDAPNERGAQLPDLNTRLILRMFERFINKGLLDGDDLMHIFGGESNANIGGFATREPQKNYRSPSAEGGSGLNPL